MKYISLHSSVECRFVHEQRVSCRRSGQLRVQGAQTANTALNLTPNIFKLDCFDKYDFERYTKIDLCAALPVMLEVFLEHFACALHCCCFLWYYKLHVSRQFIWDQLTPYSNNSTPYLSTFTHLAWDSLFSTKLTLSRNATATLCLFAQNNFSKHRGFILYRIALFLVATVIELLSLFLHLSIKTIYKNKFNQRAPKYWAKLLKSLSDRGAKIPLRLTTKGFALNMTSAYV